MLDLDMKIWYLFNKNKIGNVLYDLSDEEETMLETAIALAGDSGMAGAEKLLEKVKKKRKLTKDEAAEICQMATSFMPSAAKYIVKRMKETNNIDLIKDPMTEGKNAIRMISHAYDL